MKATKQQIAHRFGVAFIVLALIASFLLVFVFEDKEADNANKSTQQVESVALAARLEPLVAPATTPTPKAKPKATKAVVVAKPGVRAQTIAPKVRPKPKIKATVNKPHVNRVPISLWATPGDMQGKIDRCVGPVAITIPDAPLLITEHDYCGGTGRIASLRKGDRVQVAGGGGVNGTYKVVSIRYVPKGSSTSVLRGLGAVVLQTCVGNSVVLVGINRI